MRGYLGLDILAEDKQERAGRIVEEFSGPTTFSTDAAIYCVPEDAVPYAYRGPDHDAWLEYIENYFFYLGERTRGRVLGLFTNSALVKRIGERLSPKFRAIGLQLLWQGMPGLSKEEVMRTFKANHESILLGVDTFWYGVDFPGTTCEHIVIAKLPYGAPDRYMYAQQARLGYGIQRNTIYLPKALAMFRQGCGRLLRSEDDRGSITILDKRVLDGQHANFLDELPGGIDEWDKPNIVRASTDECLQHIFKHMGLKADVERRGLGTSFI
jgi:ATP-dependent DNA helicase DinG